MASVVVRRGLWGLHRMHLRHGLLGWLNLGACAGVLVLAFVVGVEFVHTLQADADIATRIAALRHAPTSAVTPSAEPSMSLPVASQRFAITQRMLTTLQKAGIAPEQIRFKYDSVVEASLTRQIAVFTIQSRWNDAARLLTQLQAADRALYVARLHISRDSADDDTVTTEVQLALALQDDATLAGGRP